MNETEITAQDKKDKELEKLVKNLLSATSCLITTSVFILISIWCGILF